MPTVPVGNRETRTDEEQQAPNNSQARGALYLRAAELMVARISEKRWEVCLSGHLHRGIYGGAGLLLRYTPSYGEPLFLLTERLRSRGSRVWGTPAGVMKRTEPPEMAARRGAAAEIWPLPRYHVVGVDSEDCGGGWRFHVVSANVGQLFTAHAIRETCRTGWFALGQMSTLPLASEFRTWVDERTALLAAQNRRAGQSAWPMNVGDGE